MLVLSIVQDPASVEVAIMPKLAIDNAPVDYILPLDLDRRIFVKYASTFFQQGKPI